MRSDAALAGERRVDGATEVEVRSYLSSLPADAARITTAVRAHLGIENRVHWVLDVAFREDHSRVRVDHAAGNFAVRRHLARNLLRNERPPRVGIKAKRRRCDWGHAYFLNVLASRNAVALGCQTMVLTPGAAVL